MVEGSKNENYDFVSLDDNKNSIIRIGRVTENKKGIQLAYLLFDFN